MPRALRARLPVLLITLHLSGCTFAGPVDMGNNNADPSARVSWCGALRLPDHTPQDASLGGLSDLAWQADNNTLYLLSDRGWLFQAQPRFERDTLSELTITAAHQLRNRHGQVLEMPHADAESMTLDATHTPATLLIGFERDHRIQRFSLTGQAISAADRPKALEGVHYNGGIEAMTLTTRYGLMAGLEVPPRGNPARTTRLFNDRGQQWQYVLADEPASALTSMAPLSIPNQPEKEALLTLERAFDPPHPLVITLRRTRLNDDGSTSVTTLARLSSADGWRLDNFEGLTRIGAHRYLMVSDDNYSLLQSSLLSCIDVDTDQHQD
ncbi:esterase-like activity of phytase family protein [Kushneria phosphatilytica]|uniref:Esterase-like activity of phytase family protein n=1 Tax=Kushneria phosphatilytica TaxID=657387 RepID=A0A1S1NZM5_9GAMM|nr:esterase-like activity of phytase family protein [Kushneria phosphatilytica]OHV11225.1 hypothetical protein BH688_07850 [Kushneria phosphatilytica]QEL12202.1 esterase-like activity of phytase family protein [Kushneria phosphatilytica]